MDLITWDTNLSVNVAEIDRQHKQLITMINELHNAMRERKTGDVLEGIISGLIKYTRTHFATEERYFDQFGYPETGTHKAEHVAFVKKVSDFKTGFDSGKILLSMEIINFLKDWLIKHIQGTDKKYSPFLNKNGIK